MFLLEAAQTVARYADQPSNIGVALQFMGVGVAGVFVVLAFFYVIIKLMIKLAPDKGED